MPPSQQKSPKFNIFVTTAWKRGIAPKCHSGRPPKAWKWSRVQALGNAVEGGKTRCSDTISRAFSPKKIGLVSSSIGSAPNRMRVTVLLRTSFPWCGNEPISATHLPKSSHANGVRHGVSKEMHALGTKLDLTGTARSTREKVTCEVVAPPQTFAGSHSRNEPASAVGSRPTPGMDSSRMANFIVLVARCR